MSKPLEPMGERTASERPSISSAERAILAADQFGFMTDVQLARLAAEDRLRPVLVRCGGGRFVCPAQDAAHFIGIIDRGARTWKSGEAPVLVGERDYIRDVCLAMMEGAYYHPERS